MNIDFRDSLVKHIDFFWKHYEESPVVYIGNTENNELLSITDTLSFCEKYGEAYENYEDKGACLQIRISKKNGTTAKLSAIGQEFIDVETYDWFHYGYPFSDTEEGANKCIEVLRNVFGVIGDKGIVVKTEIGERIYRTEAILKQELNSYKRKPTKPSETTIPYKDMPKKTPLNHKIALGILCCLLLFPLYLFIKDVIVTPIESHRSRYEIKEDGTIDVSNMKEWNLQTEYPSDLPETECIYLWCLRNNIELPKPLITDLGLKKIDYKTVICNADTLKVLYVGSTLNLKNTITKDIIGPTQSTMRSIIGTMALKSPYPTTRPGNTKDRYRKYREFPDYQEAALSHFMAKTMRLLYYPTSLFNAGIDDEKELINTLKPPLDLWSTIKDDTLNAEYKRVIRGCIQSYDLQKVVDKYKTTHQIPPY